MFSQQRNTSALAASFRFSELLFHTIVRVVRRTHRNAIVGLASNIMQTVVLVAVFYFMFSVLGLRGLAIRGDFLIYLMTGIFLYLTHNKTLGAVLGSEGPASSIMKHAPMTTALSIASSALSVLYLQLLSMFVILFVVHVAFNPIVIDDPAGVALPFFLAWFSGVAIGILLLAIKPFFPGFTSIISQIYTRANMISSGKMFVANSLSPALVPYFAWNPLFHAIDQARGAAFINYNPHVSSIMYPVYFSLIFIVIGLMGEFYTRQMASASWDAGR